MNTIAPKNSLLWGLGCELALSTCGDLLLKDTDLDIHSP